MGGGERGGAGRCGARDDPTNVCLHRDIAGFLKAAVYSDVFDLVSRYAGEAPQCHVHAIVKGRPLCAAPVHVLCIRTSACSITTSRRHM